MTSTANIQGRTVVTNRPCYGTKPHIGRVWFKAGEEARVDHELADGLIVTFLDYEDTYLMPRHVFDLA